MDVMDKVKRDRSANFSLPERDILVSLVQKYQTVLENKKSDASTWKMKEAAWESIQNEFNARSGGTFRSTKTLKVKYEGLKRTVRKKSAAIRSELYRTGGGSNKAPSLDNVEEQIKSMITLSTDGMKSVYDCDVISQSHENQDVIDVPKLEEFKGISVLDVDITEVVQSETTENRKYLKYLVVSQCYFIAQSMLFHNYSLLSGNYAIFFTEVMLLVTDECEPLPITSTDTIPGETNIMLENMNDAQTLLDTPMRKNVITPCTNANKKWDVTSRRNLKSRKHSSLIANVQKKTLFDELTQAKLDLVLLQKKFLEEEITEKRKVWEFEETERKKEAEFKEKERKWKEEEYKLKLQNNFK
ncbi:uncharacterized protein [Epargyreus clarus]|uniref:uncharacterized protein isoform X1 n=1 Tax=Epargyreus clarus TaxID=520877 RepID=UPI003C2DE258